MISSACSPKGCNNCSLKFVVFTANTCLEYKLLSNSCAKTVLDQPFSIHCVVYQIKYAHFLYQSYQLTALLLSN